MLHLALRAACVPRAGLVFLGIALFTGGCRVVSGDIAQDPTTSSAASEPGGLESDDTASDGASTSSSSATDATCAKAAGASREEQVCHRWRCDGAAAARPAAWSGNAATCDAGGLDADAAARALVLVNLHRFLADLPPVVAEPAWTTAAQQCALLAHANAALSHEPPPDWRCWSALGALTSSVSLIANRSVPLSVDAYVEDPGNAETMVHRRWLLNEDLARVGFGSTDHYSCIVVDGTALGGTSLAPSSASAGTTRSDRGWVAWPPAGPVPIDLFATEKLDTLGWTVQSSSDMLDRADVVVTHTTVAGATTLPVTVTHLEALHGSQSALSFVPKGWTTEAGGSYDVRVVAGANDAKIAFTVQPVGCP